MNWYAFFSKKETSDIAITYNCMSHVVKNNTDQFSIYVDDVRALSQAKEIDPHLIAKRFKLLESIMIIREFVSQIQLLFLVAFSQI